MQASSRLTPAKQKKLLDWLATIGIRRCPLCSYPTLTARGVVSTSTFDAVRQAPEPHLLLLAAVECERCLHMMFFDAVKVGLMGQDV